MIYLYISTFGDDISWIKIPNIHPIEVGCAVRPSQKTIIYKERDDKGQNLSVKNPYFGELTGLYYIWKNKKFKPNDIVGFAHYNKYLCISKKKINKEFKKGKRWIVRYPEIIPPHKYYNDVYELEHILKESFPIYYIAWKNLYDKKGHSLNNQANCSTSQMFITNGIEFDNYCNFLFGVLIKLNNKIGSVSRNSYDKRYCAFMGERLLSVYITANKITPIYTETMNKGGKKLGILLQRFVKKNQFFSSSKCALAAWGRKKLLGNRTSSYK